MNVSGRPSEKAAFQTAQQGASLPEVLAAMLVLTVALTGFLAVLLRGTATVGAAAAQNRVAAAVADFAEGVKSNPQAAGGRYSHYLHLPPAAQCGSLPDDGSTGKTWAAYHLCRLKNALDGLPEHEAAFTVCRDTSGKEPQWPSGAASAVFFCNGKGRGVVVKAVWRPKNASADEAAGFYQIYLAE